MSHGLTFSFDAPQPKEVNFVFVDVHRHTCIRVGHTKSKTAYIPMDGNGLTVHHTTNDKFHADWMPGHGLNLQDTAQHYLDSISGAYHMSPNARTHLENIIKHGATTTKENEMTDEVQTPEKPAAKKSAAKAKPAKEAAAKKPTRKEQQAAEQKARDAAVEHHFGKGKGKTAKPAAKAAAKLAKAASEPGTVRADSKSGRLVAELQKGKPVKLAKLAEVSGYDEPNTRTAIGILRSRKGMNITYDREAQTYTLEA